jgi:histidinol-phosphatase (PHP family)
MQQTFTLHTHTTPFDGKNTAEQMIDAAQQHGMETIGISNHFIVHPDIIKTKFYPFAVSGGYNYMYNTNFNNTICKFQEHYNHLEQIAANYNINVLHGMELDLFDNRRWYNGYAHMIKTLNPDYIIGAAHFIEYGGKLCNIHDMKNAAPDDQDKMLRAYWKKIQWIAKSGMCNFLAHIDLPARQKLGLDEKWTDIEQETIDIIAEAKIPVEINTALYKYSDRPHPSPRIMKMCADKKIPMFLSDDAHHISHVCKYFEDAKKYADNFGINLIGLDKIL